MISTYDDRRSVEREEQWETWCKCIPALHFKPEWEVKIIPPFMGAMVRFYINYNNKHVSVYLDCYGRLGCVDMPYYEMYDGEDTHRYIMSNNGDINQMMDDIDKVLNGKPIV